MRKKLLLTSLLITINSPLAANDETLQQAKIAFQKEGNSLIQFMTQSSKNISQHVKKLQLRQQSLTKKQNPNNTAQEKQCLQSMIQRISTEQRLGNNFVKHLANSKKQVSAINARVAPVKTMAQLKQLSVQGKQVMAQLDRVAANNHKTLVPLVKRVEAICSKLQ